MENVMKKEGDEKLLIKMNDEISTDAPQDDGDQLVLPSLTSSRPKSKPPPVPPKPLKSGQSSECLLETENEVKNSYLFM